jgi:two-component system sensor histidine kinase VicK
MENKSYNFLQGGGEMGELIRSIDWSTTPLGPAETWPESLRLATSIVLSTPFPMYIAWGNEYTQIYNDGYRPILG